MFIGLNCFFMWREGQISPSTSFLMYSSKGIDNIPMKSLFLHKLFYLIGKGGGIFVRIKLDSFEMKDIRLIFFGIFVNLTFGNSSKDIIFVDEMWDDVENDLILVLSSRIIRNILSIFNILGNSFSLFDITDIEENSSISEWFIGWFWFRYCYFVYFYLSIKNRVYYSLHLFLKIFIIKVFLLVLTHFLLR